MNAHPGIDRSGEAIPVESPDAAPDVVIVGAGPAGLGAAALLAQAGVSVAVLERGTEAGGIPRHCGHSPFGMREFSRLLSGRVYAARLSDAAARAGAAIRLRHSAVAIGAGPVLTVATPDGIKKFAPKAVLLATGIREATRAARLAGGVRPQGVMNTGALQDLVYLRGKRPFRRPVIVGTELVSMSAILTCRHAGAKPVAVIERGDRPTVRAPFSWLPRTLGIPLHFRTTIEEIFGQAQVEAVSVRDAEGNLRRIPCDGVVFTGEFTPEASLARTAGLEVDRGSGGPLVDADGRTSLAHVYAAGNTLRAVETAGWCWEEGRTVARSILRDLRGEGASDSNSIRVEAGENVKLVVPQRLSPRSTAGAFQKLQVRLFRPVSGMLQVAADGRVLWSRRVASGPERRLGIPLAALRLPDDARTITVSVRET